MRNAVLLLALSALPAAAGAGQGRSARLPETAAAIEPLSTSAPIAASVRLTGLFAQSLAAAAPLTPAASLLPAPEPAAIVQVAQAPAGEALPGAFRQGADLTIRFDGAARLRPHPLDAVTPPDLGALDTRERRARQASGPRLHGLLPARAAGWLERRGAERRARQIRSERMTTEEESIRQSLVEIHGLLRSGDPQPALDRIIDFYDNPRARQWYVSSADFKPYWDQAMAYRRALEDGLKRDLLSAKMRGGDPALAAEARAARERVGRAWRETRIQEKDSGHCAFHAWHNAIAATTGFTRPVPVEALIAAARRALNERAAPKAVNSKLARELGLKDKPRDVGEGLDPRSEEALAAWLGVGLTRRAVPAREAELLALLRSGATLLPALRFYWGADRKLAHHQGYLLGAYKSEALGRWVYMVQDSGSGSTDLYTFEELRRVTREVVELRLERPVALPDRA